MTNRNARKQYKAERRRQKQNKRRQENQRAAQAARQELEGRPAGVVYDSGERSYDSKNEQIVTTFLRLDGEVQTVIGLFPNTLSDYDLVTEIIDDFKLDESTTPMLVLRHEPWWTVSKAIKKMTSGAYAAAANNLLKRVTHGICIKPANEFAGTVDYSVNDYCNWVMDCGDAPINGIVEVDVDPESIPHVKYNVEESKMTLDFANGATYEYDGVPRKQFSALVNADNVMRHFNNSIRDEYAGKRVA